MFGTSLCYCYYTWINLISNTFTEKSQNLTYILFNCFYKRLCKLSVHLWFYCKIKTIKLSLSDICKKNTNYFKLYLSYACTFLYSLFVSNPQTPPGLFFPTNPCIQHGDGSTCWGTKNVECILAPSPAITLLPRPFSG